VLVGAGPEGAIGKDSAMTSDPPRRWDDDSPEEDFEANRAAEADKLTSWAEAQKTRPLADALEQHGLLPRNPGGESWVALIVPDWWAGIPEPHGQCPTCQRPGVVTRFFDGDPSRPAMCPECSAAFYADPDPAPLWAWWSGLDPAARRLHIAARHGTDPWSGRHCIIEAEWTSVTPDGEISTDRDRYLGCPPAGIYWAAR
jgi:hypothetical protein